MKFKKSKNDIVNEYIEDLSADIAPLFIDIRSTILAAGPSFNESIKWKNCLVYGTTKNHIQTVVGNVTLAITVVGALVLFSGSLILIGAVSMTKFRRVYEAAILKTLGASSRLVAAMLLLEYGVLGAIAGTVGSLGAIALSWAVARFALELSWDPTPGITLTGIAVTAGLVALIGVLASIDVLRNKPLSTLRAE